MDLLLAEHIEGNRLKPEAPNFAGKNMAQA
jgi:hypothetical protein